MIISSVIILHIRCRGGHLELPWYNKNGTSLIICALYQEGTLKNILPISKENMSHKRQRNTYEAASYCLGSYISS